MAWVGWSLAYAMVDRCLICPQLPPCCLGAMILAAIRAPIWLACTVVGIFGMFHGYAHGLELPSAADPVGYSAGFVLATGLLHIFGIALGLLRSRPGGDMVVRTLGGIIVVTGLWFLANTLF